MSDREQIAQQALALPPEDRAYLADMLERSLPPGGFATPEIAAAWGEEIERRIAAYDRGEVHAEDAEIVVSRIRQRLAECRSQKVKP